MELDLELASTLGPASALAALVVDSCIVDDDDRLSSLVFSSLEKLLSRIVNFLTSEVLEEGSTSLLQDLASSSSLVEVIDPVDVC
jgi:hypothetical protein